MKKLTKTQTIAKTVGIKAGPNTFFSPDITDPDNQNVKCGINTSIAIGATTQNHLPGIIKETLRHVFAPRLDR